MVVVHIERTIGWFWLRVKCHLFKSINESESTIAREKKCVCACVRKVPDMEFLSIVCELLTNFHRVYTIIIMGKQS